MGSWSEILSEIDSNAGNEIAILNDKRLQLMEAISRYTERNVISYYSGWLTKSESPDIEINDSDKNAFMENIYKMDKSKGLDLILHTPGGGIAATESLVDYLHSMFNGDIRAIIPQMAMSAGTMIALSCSSIIMGNHSNLGPVDPQNRGISCQEALDEFEKAKDEVRADNSSLGLWQVLISKYTPTFLISCQNALEWSKTFATDWISKNPSIADDKKEGIINLFVDHSESKSHDRHISKAKCKEVGLSITDMEDDNTLQDLILSLHHCYMILFDKSIVVKVVENQLGATYWRMFREKS